MRHLTALIIKFIMVFAVLYIIQRIIYDLDLTFLSIFMMSLILTIFAYLLGDLIILPRFGNITTTIADFMLAVIVIWGFGNYWYTPLYPWASIALVSSIIITIGEWFFHKYIIKKIKVL